MTTGEKEEWRPVVGWPDYDVSNLGRVRSWRPKRRSSERRTTPFILRPTKIATGYMQVGLQQDDGSRYSARVHRLVARAFHGEPKPGFDNACHEDGIRDNNRADNLRWDSMKGNHADRARHGKTVRGARVNTARLAEAQVIDIRAALSNGETRASIARRYDVSWSTVSCIMNGASWGWLTEDAA